LSSELPPRGACRMERGIPSRTMIVRVSSEDVPALAVRDLWLGLRRTEFWWTFAVHDIKQRFRRSTFGPLWFTLNMGVMVGALGFVFHQILNQSISFFLPYLATGLIFWSLLTSIINDGCTAFVAGEGYIRNVPMPLSVHFYRVFARDIIIWVHNMVIYVIVLLLFPPQITTSNYLLFAPGFALFLANSAWLGLAAGILSTRYRDVPQVVGSAIQVVFFVTPIFWSIEAFPDRPEFVYLNPAFHLIEIVRAPLLGQAPNTISWWICSGLLAFGLPLTIALYRRSFARIPYWV